MGVCSAYLWCCTVLQFYPPARNPHLRPWSRGVGSWEFGRPILLAPGRIWWKQQMTAVAQDGDQQNVEACGGTTQNIMMTINWKFGYHDRKLINEFKMLMSEIYIEF